MNDVLLGGIIGIVGTLLGALVTYWLDLQKSKIDRQMQYRDKIRTRLLEGVLHASESHGRARLPFDAGDSLYQFSEQKSFEMIIDELKSKINTIEGREERDTLMEFLQILLESLEYRSENLPET